jgi:hypothetical protein
MFDRISDFTSSQYRKVLVETNNIDDFRVIRRSYFRASYCQSLVLAPLACASVGLTLNPLKDNAYTYIEQT